MIKSGFVSVVGRPNVGKSTLVNAIVGSKVSIVSFKPQTTRDVIRGIYNDEDSQIIFTDTPGIHKSEDSLGDIMNENAVGAAHDTDLILMLVDISKESNASDKYVIERIKNYCESRGGSYLLVPAYEKMFDVFFGNLVDLGVLK